MTGLGERGTLDLDEEGRLVRQVKRKHVRRTGGAVLQLAQSMSQLAESRPVYHSEADFQHALAMQLARENPLADIRLEYRPIPGRPIYTDIWLSVGGKQYAIELKYKTRGVTTDVLGEHFELANHGAQDIGKHDFWKDVQRVEEVCANRPGTTGAVIFLTNDQTYWNESLRAGTCAEQFHMHDGRVAAGHLSWAAHTGAGTKRSREAGVVLRESYRVLWRDYGSSQGRALRFKYALLETPAPAEGGV